MGETLENFIFGISFCVYTSEEIIEFRNNFKAKNFPKKAEKDKYVKNYDYNIPSEKLTSTSKFGEEIFENVQKKIDILLAEKEKKEDDIKKKLIYYSLIKGNI